MTALPPPDSVPPPAALRAVVCDAQRLAAVRATQLLDTPADPAYLRLARVAARVLAAPTAMVTLVDEAGDLVLGGVGLPERVAASIDVQLAPTFCQHSVTTRTPLFVDDARAIPELAAYPWIAALGMVAVASAPLITAAGQAIGSISAMDVDPRSWTDTDRELLVTLAAAAMAEIERADAPRTREAVLQRIPDALLTVDAQWRLTFANEKAAALLSTPARDLIGRGLWDVFPRGAPSAFETGCVRAVAERRCIAFESRVPQSAGSQVPRAEAWYEVHADPSGGGLSLYFRDITERRALEEQLTRQALHDPLTGLANRALFDDRVQHALRRQTRGADRPVAVVLIDVDDFSALNERWGHAVGDEVLGTIAGRLQRAARECDSVARWSGDEFAVLLEGIGGSDESVGVVERMLASLRRPLSIEGTDVWIGASAGVAHADADVSAEDLVRNAGVALGRAKAAGKARHAMFEPAMFAAVIERRELEADLRVALADPAAHGFRLVYQPLVQLASGQVAGVEALIRWQHPSRGAVSAAALIGVAEETGLMVPLGRWILRAACEQLAAWRAAAAEDAGDAGAGGADAFRLAINVSGRQLEDAAFVQDVAAALRDSRTPPHTVTLEVTESVIMRHPDQIVRTMTALKAVGVQLAIDDFGTGYSSLSYLQRFPVDVLKIDKSFVDGIAGGGADAALARTIIALADMLRLDTVAEGVEHIAQLDELRMLGCMLGQGYLFERPMEADAAGRLLRGTWGAATATAR